MMYGSHSMVQHTRITALWPWRTLVKRKLLCTAWLTKLLVANLKMGCSLGIGSFPMELEFPALVISGISTEPEGRWWYVWTVEEVKRMGSTAVRYLMQWMLPRPYTLEFTQQAVVRYTIIREFRVWVSSWELSSSWDTPCLYIVYLHCTDMCLQLCQ